MRDYLGDFFISPEDMALDLRLKPTDLLDQFRAGHLRQHASGKEDIDVVSHRKFYGVVCAAVKDDHHAGLSAGQTPGFPGPAPVCRCQRAEPS